MLQVLVAADLFLSIEKFQNGATEGLFCLWGWERTFPPSFGNSKSFGLLALKMKAVISDSWIWYCLFRLYEFCFDLSSGSFAEWEADMFGLCNGCVGCH